MRRHVVPIVDFDTRANVLNMEIRDEWEERIKTELWQNKERLLERLRAEFGTAHFDERLANFKEIGAAPFSIVAHHNNFFQQARMAFVYGTYYPALTGACSLGERILNHLVLDLRESYKSTPQYKNVYRKDSFDDWSLPIKTLTAWGVIDSEVAGHFDELRKLRNRSIHFRSDTYLTVRKDALDALRHCHEIIQKQFGSFGAHRWFIRGTKGVCFIAKAFENDPFIKAYYLGQCPPVGPYYALTFQQNGILYFDRKNYPDREISDEEFKNLYETRKPEMVVPTTLPATPRYCTNHSPVRLSPSFNLIGRIGFRVPPL